jgi:hypothetical protein
VFGTYDPRANLNHVQIDLASLPDHYDEKETFQQYIAQLALAFGVDYQEFAPLPGGQLGSASQSEILHLQSRGKGPAAILQLIQEKINDNHLVPRTVKFEFEIGDVSASRDAAEARFLRAKDLSLRVTSGIYDNLTAIELANRDGDLPDHIFERLREEPPEATRAPDPLTTEQVEGGGESQETRSILLLASQEAFAQGYVSKAEKGMIDQYLMGWLEDEDIIEMAEQFEGLREFFTVLSNLDFNIKLSDAERDNARAEMIMRLQRRDELVPPREAVEITQETIDDHQRITGKQTWITRFAKRFLKTRN